MRPLAPRLKLIALTCLLGLAAALPVAANAAQWMDVATISSTLGNNAGYLCAGDGKAGLGCPLYAPYINASGQLGIGTTAPAGPLDVSGSVGRIYVDTNGNTLAFTRPAINYIRASQTGGSLSFGTGAALSRLYIDPTGLVGISTTGPQTLLDVKGTLRIADGGEACDTQRVGAIKYAGGDFFVCRTTVNGWESLATTGANSLADRITSNSQAGVITNATGYISLTTGGVTGTVYFAPNGRLVNTEISTTGTISGTSGYFNALKIGTSPTSIPVPVVEITSDTNNIAGVGMRNPSSGGNAEFRFAIADNLNTSNLAFTMPSSANSNTPLFGLSRSAQASIFLSSSATRDLTMGTFNSGNLIFGTNNTEHLRITSTTGFVGIGTSNPSATLHVTGPLNNTSSGLVIGSTNGTVTGPRIAFYPSGNFGANIQMMAAGGLKFLTPNGTAIAYFDGGNAIPRNALEGLVMIGTGTSGLLPSTTLDISGTIKVHDSGEACDTNRLGAMKYLSGSFYVCRNTTTGWEPITAGSASIASTTVTSGISGSIIYRDASGTLTASPTFYYSPGGIAHNNFFSTDLAGGGFTWAGSTNHGFFGSIASGYISTVVSGTEAMRIVSTGYVGIGTATPSTTLTVSATGDQLTVTNGFRSLLVSAKPNGDSYVGGGGGNLYLGLYSTTNFVRIGGSSNLNVSSSLDNYFTGSGKLAIGTTVPSTTLHVAGSILMGAETSTTLATCDTNRLGAMKYQSGSFYVCQTPANGWEPLATSTSSTTPSISTGASGSLVYRNEYGYLYATNTLSISSTTGSVGIGAGAPASIGNNSLYSTGVIMAGSDLVAGNGRSIGFSNGTVGMTGNVTSGYLTLQTSATEALRIVSTGLVGIGTTAPSATLHVSGTGMVTGKMSVGYATAQLGPQMLSVNGSVAFGNGNNHIFVQGGTNLAFTSDAGGTTYYTFSGNQTGPWNLSPTLVGINTTSGRLPSTSLQVSGTIQMADGGEACDTSRLGAMRFANGSFDICRNTTSGWEPLSTSTSSTTPSISTGASGSLVYRNEYGYLYATNTLSISSTTGSIGIGAGAPAYLGNNGLYVNGQIQALSNIAGSGFSLNGGATSITGNGTPGANNYLSFTTSNTEAVRIVSTGNVGIGLLGANPGVPLQVSGVTLINARQGANYWDSQLQLASPVGTDSVDVGFASGSAALGRIRVGPAGTNLGRMLFGVRNDSLGGMYTAMAIDSTGFVGIGTTAPSSTLHIAGATNSISAGLIIGATTSNYQRLAIYPTGGLSANMRIMNPGQLNIQTGNGVNIATFNGGNMNNPWTIFARGVGIGGTYGSGVSTALSVAGTIQMGDGGEACDSDRLGGIKYISNSFYVCQNTTNGWEPLSTSGVSSTIDRIISGTTQAIAYKDTSLSLVTAGTERMVIATTGEVGIGQQPILNNYGLAVSTSVATGGNYAFTKTTGRIVWNGASTDSILGDAGQHMMSFSTNGAEAARIVSSGFVGIGTTAPSNTLHVLGTIRIGATNSANLTISGSEIRSLNNGGGGGLYLNTSNASAPVFIGGPTASVGIGVSGGGLPSTTLQVSGTIQFSNGGEACDANRLGALKYASGAFYICQNTTSGWQPLATVSGTTVGAIDDLSDAASNITSGSVYLGSGSGTSATSAIHNTAVGVGSMAANTSGGSNIAVGFNALNANTTGSNNLAVGSNALIDNTTGNGNAAFGLQSINFNVSGTRNVGLGNFALQFSTGSSNTAVGYNAGGPLTAGDGNLFLGANTTPYSTTGSYQLNIGNAIWGDIGSNTANANKIGINVTSPTANLEVSGTVSATRFVGDGSGLTGVGGTPDRITSGTTQAIAYNNTSLSLVTNGTERMVIGTAGLVGIAQQPDPSYTLAVSGSGYYGNNLAVAGPIYSGSKLSVTGQAQIVGNVVASGNYIFNSIADQGLLWGFNTNTAIMGNSKVPYLGFNVSGTEAMHIISTGLVGIGTSTPSAALHVKGGTNLLTLESLTGSPMNLQFLAGTANSVQSIKFGTSTTATIGNFSYDLSTNRFSWYTGAGTTHMVLDNGNGLGINIGNNSVSATLHVSGTIRMSDGGEACDTNRLGALKYASGAFYICQNTANGWEPLATAGPTSLADRITSGSQAGVIANSTGYISLTTGGVTGTAYFTPAAVLVGGGVSSTGPISGTFGYFANTVGIGTLPGPSTFSLTGNWGIKSINGVFSGSSGSAAGPTFTFNGANNTGMFGGGANSLAFSTSGTEAVRITSNSYVGIGTTTPSATLHVVGPAGSQLQVGANSNANSGITWGSTAQGGQATIQTDSAHDFIFSSRTGGTLYERMRFNWNGNNGFGTSNPQTLLDISGTVRIANSGEACDANRAGAIKYTSSTFYTCDGTTGWTAFGGSTPTSATVTTGISGSVIYRDGSGTLTAQTPFIINSSGTLGIGTSSTIQDSLGLNALYVNGIIRADGGITDSGNFNFNAGSLRRINWSPGTAAAVNIAGDNGNGYLAFTTSGTEALRIVSTGYVGIGTTAPSATLDVSGSAAITHLLVNTHTDLGSTVSANIAGTLAVTNGAVGYFMQQQSAGNQLLFNSNAATGGVYIFNGFTGGTSTPTLVGIGTIKTQLPSTSLQVSGTIQMADGGEACDTSRLGAIKYKSGSFYVCQTTANGWEPLSTSTSSTTPSISTGASGSLVYRNEFGYLYASSSLSISSTTGSVGIGAGAPSWIDNYSLYSAGSVAASRNIYVGSGYPVSWGTGTSNIIGDTSSKFLSFTTSGTEAMRIISTGLVGIGTSTPAGTLHVMTSSSAPFVLGNTGTAFNSTMYMNANGTLNATAPGSVINTFGNTGSLYSIGTVSSPSTLNVTSGGLVGIGTTAPSATLDIIATSSTLRLKGTDTSFNMQTAGGRNFLIGAYDSSQNIYMGSISNHTLGLRANNITMLALSPANGVNAYTSMTVGGGASYTPSVTLHVSGTIRIADSGETCDANRAGAIKYTSSTFYTCDGSTGWQPFSGTGASTGASTFASLTDVSSSFAAGNIFGPGSLSGATSAVTNTTAFGQGALASASNSGNNNAAYGQDALNANTAGHHNTALGTLAMKLNTTGNYNTAVGYGSMASSNGTSNVSVGANTLATFQQGIDNTAVGTSALANAVSTSYNTILGAYTLNLLVKGSANTAIGHGAMQFENGSYNTGIGKSVGGNGTVTATTMLGYMAGNSLGTSTSNTLIGYTAGNNLTTGSNNLAIGASVNPLSATGSNQLAIGNAIWGDLGSGTGNANKIGINVTSPTANLEVSGTISATQFIGDGSLLTNLPGGTSDRITSGTTQAIAYNNTSLSLVTNGTERLVIGTAGNVGIGMQPFASSVALSVSGTSYISGRLSLLTPVSSNVIVGANAGSANTGSNVVGMGLYSVAGNSGASVAAFGNYSAQNNTAANLSAFGMNAGYNNTGVNSTLLGFQSGQYNTGSGVTAVGLNAAQSNTVANVTAVGSGAAQFNSGASLVAMGSSAGANNSGTAVTAVGYNAAYNNNAANTVAYGYAAAQNNAGANITAIGFQSAQSNTVPGLSALGYNAAQYNAGTNSTIMGFQSGQNNTANYLTAFGYQAGQNNTAAQVTALGTSAGQNNSGSNLTAIGYQAGQNSSGTSVVTVGNNAASSNMGSNVNALGANAAQLNTGDNLVAIGTSTARYNTGQYNTAVGNIASQYNTSGGQANVTVGYMAGQGVSNSTSYSRNTLLGAYAGNLVTSGSSNTVIGHNAAGGLTTGNSNIIIGAGISPLDNTGSNQLNIGNAIMGDLGRPLATRIGINVTSPTANLEVSGTVSATRFVGDGSGLTGVGGGGGDRITSGTTSAIANTAGYLTLTTLGTEAMRIVSSGYVGIGTTDPVANLDVRHGNVYVGDGTNIASASQYWMLVDGTLGILNNGSLEFNIGGTRTDVNAAGVQRNSGSISSFNFTSSGGMAVGVNTDQPSTTLSVSGTLRIADGGETCDANRSGSIKYTSSTFYTCDGTTGWKTLGSGSAGASTYASLTDVSVSIAAGNLYGPGSAGAVSTTSSHNTAFGLNAMKAVATAVGSNSAFGYNALATNTTGNGNVAVGYAAIASNTSGGLNTGLGYAALGANTTGSYNVAVGPQALTANTTGNSNVAIGYASIGTNTTGASNTAIGYSTLSANTTGYYNTAIGYLALTTNSTGFDNAATGISALQNNTTGDNNNSYGFNNMLNNTSGIANTSMGSDAFRFSKTGNYNTVVGRSAGYGVTNNSFSGSNLFGAYAGQGLTTGNSNTLIGYNAGGAITTGNNNIVIGNGLGSGLSPFANTGSNQLNLGDSIFGDLRGSLASRIGINVTSPTAALEVSGTVSFTTVAASGFTLTGVAGSAGVSLTGAGDNLGNHTATQDLAMSGFNITGALAVSASSTIKTTAALQSGNTDTTCSTAADYGKMRFDSTTGTLFLCRP